MGYENSVTIGPEFFAKAKNDYASFPWAIAREFLQNSMDCGSDNVGVNIVTLEGVTHLTVHNNGSPMSREILTGKLLSLGGTGKGFAGAVGGFGKAKEVLYFCHRSYEIHTGALRVNGSGAGYNLFELPDNVCEGTVSQIVMDGDYTEKLIGAFQNFALLAQWDGTIHINGEKFNCDLRKGSPRREFEWGTVYTNKTFKGRVVVRVGGIPMFTRFTQLDRCVVIELKGASSETLQSSRDGLVWRLQDEFDTFLGQLITNKSRALKADNPSYRHFGGARFKTSKENPERKAASARDLVGEIVPAGETRFAALVNVGGGSTGEPSFGGGGAGSVVSGERLGVLEQPEEAIEEGYTRTGVPTLVPNRPVSVISEEFVLKNETTLKIPDAYCPDADGFGQYGRKLARMWGRLLVQLHRLQELEAEFAIGFVFSEDAAAQFEKSNEFGTVYYINPVEIVEQKASSSKSMRKKFALTERDRVLALAVHEFVHGMGFDEHNEDYAREITYLFAKVMKDRKSFNWCFA